MVQISLRLFHSKSSNKKYENIISNVKLYYKQKKHFLETEKQFGQKCWVTW